MRKDDISTVFFARRADDAAARTLASDLDLRTDVLDPLESVDESADQNYFTAMRKNLRSLRTALGAV